VSAEGSSGCRSHTGARIQAKNSSAKQNSLGASPYQNQLVHRVHCSFTRKVRISQSKVGLQRGRAELCQSTGGIGFTWPTATPVNQSSLSGLLIPGKVQRNYKQPSCKQTPFKLRGSERDRVEGSAHKPVVKEKYFPTPP